MKYIKIIMWWRALATGWICIYSWQFGNVEEIMILYQIKIIALSYSCHSPDRWPHGGSCVAVLIYIYQMDCVCQRCHKECSTRTCTDDYYYCWKNPNSNHLCDHCFMGVIITPIARQSKIDFMHKQVITALTSLRQSFCNAFWHGNSYIWQQLSGPTGGPPGSCRPQMGPMLAPWTLLSGNVYNVTVKCAGYRSSYRLIDYTLYLAWMSELWSVYGHLWKKKLRNWSVYAEVWLYIFFMWICFMIPLGGKEWPWLQLLIHLCRRRFCEFLLESDV